MAKNLPKGITKRPDGRYMGRFQYEGENYCLYDTDLEKLKERLEDMRYELRHGIYEKEKNITVDGWFRTWMEEYKKTTVKDGTILNYTQTYENHIKKPFGKKKMRDIRPEHVQRLYNSLASKYSDSIMDKVAAVLSGMFKQALRNQIISKNPVPLATLPKGAVKKESRVMSLEEQKLFLEFAGKHTYGYIFEFALCTGMRAGEICALEWCDIDFNKRIIHVRGTLTCYDGEIKKDTPKTKSSKRDIPMLDNVYNILRSVKKEQAQMRISLGDKWQGAAPFDNMVFTTKTGKYIRPYSLQSYVRTIIGRIHEAGHEFEVIHPHTFRHTFATRCIENGMEPQVLKAIMGHSSLAITMDLYAHVLPDSKVTEMKKLESLYG